MHLYSCIWISISFLYSQVKVTESKLVTHRWALQLGWERDISKQQHCCGHIHGQRLAPCSWAQTPVTRSNKKLWFYNGAELSPKINSNFYIYFLKHRISKKRKKEKKALVTCDWVSSELMQEPLFTFQMRMWRSLVPPPDARIFGCHGHQAKA